MATTDEQVPRRMSAELKGGLLAEEMGLGKTVEMITLFKLHKWNPAKQSPSPRKFPQCPATLIITPPAILQQWKNELRTLASGLTVLVYEGLRVEAGKSNHETLISRCTQNDIVLTTYNVLAKEIHYAETPSRSLRHEKKYAKRLSPLTQIHVRHFSGISPPPLSYSNNCLHMMMLTQILQVVACSTRRSSNGGERCLKRC